MDKTKYIFNTLFFVPFQTFRIGRAIDRRQNCGCGGNPRRPKTFKSLIFIFVFIPFFLKSSPSFAFEVMNEFRHGFIMFRELSQDEKIQSSTIGFELIDSMVKRVSECFIVSEVFASPGMPESELVRSDNTKQSNSSGNKNDDEIGFYLALLPIFFMLLFTFIFRIRGHNYNI